MSIIPVICHNYLANSRKCSNECNNLSSNKVKKSKYVNKSCYYSLDNIDRVVFVEDLRKSFDANNQRGGVRW